jgi:hypothetical protein
MLRRVALVRTDVSEDLSASFIRVTRIGELGTTLAETSNRRTITDSCHPDEGGAKFLRNICSYTRATRRNISEDGILHSHRRENLNLTSCFLSPRDPVRDIFLAVTNRETNPVLYCKEDAFITPGNRNCHFITQDQHV